MEFEKCNKGLDCGDDDWFDISIDALKRECTEKEINLMVLQRATIRKGDFRYRRKFPPIIKDWAKNT